MNRADLDARNWAVIRRYLRRLGDDASTPPPGLLDDLAAVAAQHAEDVGVIAVRREDDAPSPEQIATWIRDNPEAWQREIRKLARMQGGDTSLTAAFGGDPPTPAPRRTRRSTPK